MSTPSMTTLPRSGLSRPISVLSRTDLPVPDGPSITQISPAGTVSVTSPQMSCLPKDLVRPSIWISTPMVRASSQGVAGHAGLAAVLPGVNAGVAEKLRAGDQGWVQAGTGLLRGCSFGYGTPRPIRSEELQE